MSAAPRMSAPEPEGRPAPRRSYRVGQACFALGVALMLLALGAAAGYWVADAGTRWLPDMMAGLIAAGMLALVLMIGGMIAIGPYTGRELGRRRIVALCLLLLVAGGARVAVHHISQPKPLTQLDARSFQIYFERDTQQLRVLGRSLERLIDAVRNRAELFPLAGHVRVATADEERFLVDVWAAFVDTTLALEHIRRFYEDYYAVDLSRLERDRHVRSFLLTFGAELAVYEHGRTMLEVLDRNPNVIKLLELPRRDRGLNAGSVTWVREELTGVTDLARVAAGRRYLGALDVAYDARAEARARGDHRLWRRLERAIDRLDATGVFDATTESVTADLAPLMRTFKDTTFPVQKGIAAFMGDYKFRRKGRYLIGGQQIAELRPDLAPGDILLSRKNWYLSNIGLPGFWPHALIYVGTAEQLAEAFDADPETLAWVERQTGVAQPFSQYIAETYPRAWKRRQRSARRAHPLLVIEAISEGVVQNNLLRAAGDYLAALRPAQVPTWVKARAIDFAFASLGTPYDFDFDFATDHALVCTELVWRAYRPREGGPGLHIDPVIVAGRKTLPANLFARLFARERLAVGRQLEFVAYVEGREADGTAGARDAVAFAETHHRSKWDFAQD